MSLFTLQSQLGVVQSHCNFVRQHEGIAAKLSARVDYTLTAHQHIHGHLAGLAPELFRGDGFVFLVEEVLHACRVFDTDCIGAGLVLNLPSVGLEDWATAVPLEHHVSCANPVLFEVLDGHIVLVLYVLVQHCNYFLLALEVRQINFTGVFQFFLDGFEQDVVFT